MSVNKVILVGNLGGDPEIRELDGGKKVASFSMATTESYKKANGEKVNETEWHNIVLWNGLAGVAEKYLSKGDKIYLEGKKKTRSWEKDGKTHYSVDIIGNNMQMLGGNNSEKKAEPASSTSQSESLTPQDDDMPF